MHYIAFSQRENRENALNIHFKRDLSSAKAKLFKKMRLMKEIQQRPHPLKYTIIPLDKNE